MSIKAMNYVWSHSKSQGTARLTLLALADSCNDDGEWSPGVASLAKKVNLGERQTQRCLRELEQTGEIRILQNQGFKTGSGSTNKYQMVLYRQMYGFEAVTSMTPLDAQSGDKRDTPWGEGVTSMTPQGVTSMTPNTPVYPSVKNNTPGDSAPVSLPSSKSTGDPMLDAAIAKQERRQKQGGNYVQDWQVDLNKKLPAKERLVIVEGLARMFGLTAKLNTDSKTLETFHRQSVSLFEMGYTTLEQIECLFNLWMTDEWRRKNKDKITIFKFTDFASQRKEEEKQKESRPKKVIKIYNQYTGQNEERVIG